jgi:hypothetical protein
MKKQTNRQTTNRNKITEQTKMTPKKKNTAKKQKQTMLPKITKHYGRVTTRQHQPTILRCCLCEKKENNSKNHICTIVELSFSGKLFVI